MLSRVRARVASELLGPQEISNLAWAMATLAYEEPFTMAYLRAQAAPQIRLFTPQGLSPPPMLLFVGGTSGRGPTYSFRVETVHG